MIFDMNINDTRTFFGENDIRSFIVFNNKLYFSASNSVGVWKYWYIEGRSSLYVVGEINPVTSPVVSNGKLYLFAQDENEFIQLWSTDGTYNSLTYLADVGRGPVDHTFVNGTLYYTQYVGRITQVTDCGVAEINTGDQYVYNLEGFGDHLVYSAYSSATGVEPYIYYNIGNISPACTTSESARIAGGSENENVFTPWPNPYTADFTLRVDGAEGEQADVSVYNASGFPVDTFKGISTNTEYKNLGATWPKGIYLVKVFKQGVMTTHRLVKK
jgi:hypothetical protein